MSFADFILNQYYFYNSGKFEVERTSAMFLKKTAVFCIAVLNSLKLACSFSCAPFRSTTTRALSSWFAPTYVTSILPVSFLNEKIGYDSHFDQIRNGYFFVLSVFRVFTFEASNKISWNYSNISSNFFSNTAKKMKKMTLLRK